MRRLIPLLLLSGCMTAFRGTTEPVAFTSDPPGATVTCGDQRGVTPCVMSLYRRGEYQVAYEWGESTVEGVVSSRFSTGAWVSELLLVSLIGSLVDAISGAAWYRPALITGDLDSGAVACQWDATASQAAPERAVPVDATSTPNGYRIRPEGESLRDRGFGDW